MTRMHTFVAVALLANALLGPICMSGMAAPPAEAHHAHAGHDGSDCDDCPETDDGCADHCLEQATSVSRSTNVSPSAPDAGLTAARPEPAHGDAAPSSHRTNGTDPPPWPRGTETTVLLL